MKTVGELHQDDANVIDHGEEHLANVFGLTSLGGHQIDAADFRGALDDASHIWAEHFRDLLHGNSGVFDDIVEQGGAKRGDVELHVDQNVSDGERVREVRFARLAQSVSDAAGKQNRRRDGGDPCRRRGGCDAPCPSPRRNAGRGCAGRRDSRTVCFLDSRLEYCTTERRKFQQ